MPTYKVHIAGDKNYRNQEILIDGVNSGSSALDVARARYPGANVKSPRLVDGYDIGRREEDNRREAERKQKIEEQNQRFKNQENNIKSSAGGSSGTTSSSYSNTSSNSSSGGSEFSTGDIMGLVVIGAVGLALWVLWFIGPFLLPVVGLVCGYKYSSKWSVNQHFQLRMWLVIMSTLVATWVGAFGASAVINLQQNEALPEFLQRGQVENPLSE